MATKLSDEIKALVRGANFAHLATLMPDGSPPGAPVWVDLEGDRLLVCTGEASLKAKNTKRDARVALSVIAMDNSYKAAQLPGRVVERPPAPGFETIDRSARPSSRSAATSRAGGARSSQPSACTRRSP